MNVTSLPDGIAFNRPIGEGSGVEIAIREIRREHTGMHGFVTLMFGDTILGYDTFNIGRGEERMRLVKASHKMLSGLSAELYSVEAMRHDLDLLCLYATRHYEQNRFQTEEIDPTEHPGPPVYLLRPFIIRGGGSILFAPPKSGKSFIFQIMAVCVAQGIAGPFEAVQKTPVLYVNLERSREEFLRREAAIRTCLGVSGGSGVRYLHARGRGLRAVTPTIAAWHREVGPGLVLYDSISRTGLGKLIDDDVANAFTDTVNGNSETWGALAHTPRADATHQFGSVHYEAGQDIGVRVASEHREAELGVMLKVTMANAAGLAPPWFTRLMFDGPDGQLIKIEKAKPNDYPTLQGGKPSLIDDLISYVGEVGKASATEIAKGTGHHRVSVSDALRADKRFASIGKEGREVMWSLKPHLEE